MSEPRRLLQDGGSDLERALLRSARADAPSSASRKKTLVALGLASGIGVAVTTTTVASTATTAVVAKSAGTLAFLKWIGAGVVCGALTLGIVNAVSPVPPPPAAPSSPAAVLPREPAPVVAPAPRHVETEAPAPPDPGPSPSADPSPPPAQPVLPKPAPTSLGEEVAALDGAREALSGGDPGRALRALDDHDRRFPRGSLGPEATVLRIEALVQRGDRASATRLGTAFLTAHPRSPIAARLRTLLGLPAPSPAAP